jgi:NADH:ubiquinone oxidoreductase subunit E
VEPIAVDLEKVHSILDKHRNEKWGLIPALQEIQETFGYIPQETVEPVAEALGVFPSQVQGVVSFYAGFSLHPKGKNVVRVCRGTACHVRGGRAILRMVKRELGIEEGQTTEDFKFTLETVACLGACFLAPTMMVNRNYFGRLSPPKISSILGQHP